MTICELRDLNPRKDFYRGAMRSPGSCSYGEDPSFYPDLDPTKGSFYSASSLLEPMGVPSSKAAT